MRPSLAWEKAASILSTSLCSQCLRPQIRPRVLSEKIPFKHSPAWINHLHTTSHRLKDLKDLEAIAKAVLEITSYDGKMPKWQQRRILAGLDKEEQKTARKRIKRALLPQRREAMAANERRIKEAGGAELEPLPKNAAKRAKKTKKAKRKRTSAPHDPRLQGNSSISEPFEPGEVVGFDEVK